MPADATLPPGESDPNAAAPLAGRTVVVTRAGHQADEFAALLRGAGATALVVPVIAIAPPGDHGLALRQAVGALGAGAYRWVIVSSPNAATRLADAVHGPDDLGGARVCAMGPGTAQVLASSGLPVDLVPDQFVAESLVDVFDRPDGGDPAPRVLVPRAAVARDTLVDGLAAKGWQVDVVEAYQTVPAVVGPHDIESVAGADAVTFTSSSTVDRFADAVGVSRAPAVVACIGPITAATAHDRGFAGVVVAEPHTLDGLLDVLVDSLARGSGPAAAGP